MNFTEQLKVAEEQQIKDALNQLFTQKQLLLLHKILNHEVLGKTEYEYYIRVVKPRLQAVSKLKQFSDIAVDQRPMK